MKGQKETVVLYRWGCEMLKLDIIRVDKGQISPVNKADLWSVGPSLEVIPTSPNLKITPKQMGYPFIKITIDLITAYISEHKWV